MFYFRLTIPLVMCMRDVTIAVLCWLLSLCIYFLFVFFSFACFWLPASGEIKMHILKTWRRYLLRNLSWRLVTMLLQYSSLFPFLCLCSVWLFVCFFLCLFFCLLPFCCSLTYRFSHYYTAYARWPSVCSLLVASLCETHYLCHCMLCVLLVK